MAGPAISLIDQSVGVTQAPRLAVYPSPAQPALSSTDVCAIQKGSLLPIAAAVEWRRSDVKRLESAWFST